MSDRRDNSGALFKNERKEKDTHPDYSGSVMIAGVEYYIDAWIKRVAGKKTFMSLSFKQKQARQQQSQQPSQPAPRPPAPPPAPPRPPESEYQDPKETDPDIPF